MIIKTETEKTRSNPLALMNFMLSKSHQVIIKDSKGWCITPYIL